MSQSDPFEDYRRRREIEVMESRFRERAAKQRKKLETLLAGEVDPNEMERKVNQEMQDFLTGATQTAEKMIEILRADEAGEVKEEIRAEIENVFGGDPGAPPAPAPAPGAAPSAPGLGRRSSAPVAKPGPSGSSPAPATRRSLGAAKPGEGRAVMDLNSALQRIRSHIRRKEERRGSAPSPEEDDPSETTSEILAGTRRQILESFDQTFDQVAEVIQRRMEFAGLEPAGAARPAGGAEPPGPSPPSAPPPPAAPPPAGDLSEEADAGTPPGVTNVFAAEVEEDRDLDDDVDPAEPPGWNIPSRPPPPGAWVVERQKEEGEAGLSGMAGDTYLLRKLSQEVRRLNRVYRALLAKGVVTREEVEGSGRGPAPKRGGEGEPDDDDAMSVDDYDEDRYRPILTSEDDFSLSGLVQDVHRLKQLRDVLVKKGVVSEKDLKKAE